MQRCGPNQEAIQLRSASLRQIPRCPLVRVRPVEQAQGTERFVHKTVRWNDAASPRAPKQAGYNADLTLKQHQSLFARFTRVGNALAHGAFPAKSCEQPVQLKTEVKRLEC